MWSGKRESGIRRVGVEEGVIIGVWDRKREWE